MTRPAPSASANAARTRSARLNTVGTDTDEADGRVTIRERDSMEQVRIPISEVKAWLSERVKF